MAGLSQSGFTTKRFNEIITDLKDNAQPIFQDLVKPGEEVDTGDQSTIGRLIGLVTPSIDDLWQAMLQLYQAFDVDSATGNALDNLAAIGGILRFPARPTRTDVHVTGLRNTSIISGVVRSDGQQITFNLNNQINFDKEEVVGVGFTAIELFPSTEYFIRFKLPSAPGYNEIRVTSSSTTNTEDIFEKFENAVRDEFPYLKTYRLEDNLFIQSVDPFIEYVFEFDYKLSYNYNVILSSATSEEVGAFTVPANTLNIISTPNYGWIAVNNPIDATPGRLLETDEALRERFRDTKFDRSVNLVESLYSALYALQGVNNLVIYENDTDIEDEKGLPPHSFTVLIDGANPDDIARAIWQNRPVGILSVGTTSVEIVDAYGYKRNIRFSRPEFVDVYVELSITTNDFFPQNGYDQIKDALVSYINGQSLYTDLIYSRLYTPINSVPGHQVNSLLIGTGPANLAATNIPLLYNQITKTSRVNITFV